MARFAPHIFLNAFIDKGFKSIGFNTFLFSLSKNNFSSLYNKLSFLNLTGLKDLSGFLFIPLFNTFSTTIGHLQYHYSSPYIPLLEVSDTTIEHLQYHYSTPYIPLLRVSNTTMEHLQYHYSAPSIPLLEVSNTTIGHLQEHYFCENFTDFWKNFMKFPKFFTDFSEKKCFSATSKTVQNAKIQVNNQ